MLESTESWGFLFHKLCIEIAPKCNSQHFLQRKSVGCHIFYSEKVLAVTFFTTIKCRILQSLQQKI